MYYIAYISWYYININIIHGDVLYYILYILYIDIMIYINIMP